MNRLLAGIAITVAAVAHAPAARADEGTVHGSKDFGLHSPRSRAIYQSDQPFEHAVDSRRRVFVIEAAAGFGPEGNLGLAVGWLPKQLHGVEFYGGAGIEVNPAILVSGAVRFVFNLHGYRPYLGLGYFYKDLFATDVYAHHAFLEGGYSWKLGSTNHLTIGLGIARLLHVGVRNESVLRTSDVPPGALDQAVDTIAPYRPTFAVRFSRAF